MSGRLRAAIARLNPQIPQDAREDALRKLLAVERPSLIEENRRLHRATVEGVRVEYRAEDGSIRGDAVRLIDPEDRLNNWLAIAQFTVIEDGHNRRPDVVVFLNGLPVGVIEVKKPGAETATLGAAFDQLQTNTQNRIRNRPGLTRPRPLLPFWNGGISSARFAAALTIQRD